MQFELCVMVWVKPLNHINDVPRQVRLRQPLLHRRRRQVVRLSINRLKGHCLGPLK